MTEEQPFELKPIEPVTFDADLFQSLIDEQARITALYGPRLKSVSGCAALVHWLMRQFPEADPGATTVTLLGSVAVIVDDDVPFDSLRLTYADGTHKDVRVIEAPEDVANFRIEMPPPVPPMTGFAEGARRFVRDGGRPLLYDPDGVMGEQP